MYLECIKPDSPSSELTWESKKQKICLEREAASRSGSNRWTYDFCK